MLSSKHAADCTFDFSLDALDFKERLSRELSAAQITELDDDALDMLSAAGNAEPQPEDELFFP